MADDDVNIIISATDKASQTFKKIGGTGKTTFTELSSAIGLANRVWNAAAGFIRDTAGETLNYANNVRALTTAIGATPEEASKLIQVADDMGVSFNQLNSALEAGIRKGIKPTIENLGKMSDEYLELNPGVERSEYLMANFGRTGQDLARIMELGSGKIEEMGDEIEGTARLMDQDALDAAEDYRLALDNMNDTVQDLKLSIGQGLIPELNNLAEWADRNATAYNVTNEAYEKGIITKWEWIRANSFLFGSEAKNQKQVDAVAEQLEGYNRMLADAEKRSRGAGRSTDEHRKAVTTLDATIESANGAMDEQQAILDGYASPAEKAEQAILAAAAAEAEAYRNARNWKSSLGESVSLLDRLNTMDLSFGDKIREQLDKMAWDAAGGDVIQSAAGRVNKALESGAITKPQAEAMLKELAVASDTLAADINKTDFNELAKNLADDLHIPLDEAKLKAEAAIAAIKAGEMDSFMWDIVLRFLPTFSGAYEGKDAGGIVINPGKGKKKNGPLAGQMASGGPVVADLTYMVGERGPEMFVPNTSGSIVPNHALGGGNVINIYPLPGQDENAIAAKVIAALSRGNRRGASGAAYAGV